MQKCELCGFPPDEHGIKSCLECGKQICCFCYTYTANEANLLLELGFQNKEPSTKMGRCISCSRKIFGAKNNKKGE